MNLQKSTNILNPFQTKSPSPKNIKSCSLEHLSSNTIKVFHEQRKKHPTEKRSSMSLLCFGFWLNASHHFSQTKSSTAAASTTHSSSFATFHFSLSHFMLTLSPWKLQPARLPACLPVAFLWHVIFIYLNFK